MKSQKKTLLPDLETLTPLLIGVWRRFHKLSGPPDKLQTREFRTVVEAVKALESRFLDGKSLIGQDYFADPNLLGAYILYQWVIHYQQGLSIIGELPTTPRRVLDVCSGAAPFAFAALRHGAQEVIATDHNAMALKLGGEICGRYGLPLSVRKWNCKQHCPIEGKFDLIILGHCLEELFPAERKGWQEEQLKFLKNLIDKLTPNGYLMITESSFGESNKRVLQLRDTLVEDGVPVQAPCVWRGECPALKTANSPCYAQREMEKSHLIKEIQRGASINLGSLKMSYVIFRNPTAGWPDLGDKKLYRVISPPVEAFGGKRFYLCGTDGKKQLGSRLENHPVESRAFEYLRRGELISFSDVLEKQSAIDIIEGSQVHVEAACGKPLPDLDID
jgi:SAM-dependent methyltransferase